MIRQPPPIKSHNGTDNLMASIALERDDFHGDWNYTIWPMKKRRKKRGSG